MAKNLFEVVQNLLIPFLLLPVVCSVIYNFDNIKIKKLFWNCVVFMFFSVLIVSVFRQWRLIKYNQINNVYLLIISIICGFIFCVLLKLYELKIFIVEKYVSETVIAVLGFIYIFCIMLYKIPLVIFLPLQFLGIGENIFTTMYLLKVTGFTLGWLTCILLAIGFYKLLCRIPLKKITKIVFFMYLLSGFIFFVSVIGIINSYYRRKIKLPLGLRKKIPYLITAENITYFLVLFFVILESAFFFIKHTKIHGEYENPAQYRLLRRFERDCRRFGVFVIVLGVISFFDLTVVKKKASKLVKLSPSEEFQIEENRIFIPLEQVSDGHLHRFSWTNEKGKTIRFIIVQKQGTNFGVGFDACEVCGNVGYYERKNEIVCNRCDVVMNKNTIGLKGGCNPIPLASFIADGGINILTNDLELEAGRF